MGFPIFFDTCVLFGENVNDLVLRLAEERLFIPYWPTGVVNELRANLVPLIGEERAVRRLSAMEDAFPDALVVGYESLIGDMTCDNKDRHVLAAAYHSPAQTLVTFNVKDFPATSMRKVGMELKHPDDFLLDVLDLDPRCVARVCYAALLSYRKYPQTPEDYCDLLARSGLKQFADHIYQGLDALYG